MNRTPLSPVLMTHWMIFFPFRLPLLIFIIQSRERVQGGGMWSDCYWPSCPYSLSLINSYDTLKNFSLFLFITKLCIVVPWREKWHSHTDTDNQQRCALRAREEGCRTAPGEAWSRRRPGNALSSSVSFVVETSLVVEVHGKFCDFPCPLQPSVLSSAV